MNSYTITAVKEVLFTVHVEAESVEDAKEAFYSGDYSDGQEVDILNEQVRSVRLDNE